MPGHSPLCFVQGAAMSVGWRNVSASLPEIIFKTVSEALRVSGVELEQIDSVVLASHDVVDGRSLSSMVTAPAAAAYLRDEIRLSEDGLAAISLASARIESGETELSIVAGWGRASEGDYLHTSRFAFDPFFEQPFAVDELTVSALRLSAWIGEYGKHLSERQIAADVRQARARRNSRAIQEEIRPQLSFPFRANEGPRLADIVVATVLGKRPAPVRLVGVGHSAEAPGIGDRNLLTMQALRDAVSRAGGAVPTSNQHLDVVQLGGLTLVDEALALEALGIAAPGKGFDAYTRLSVNPSGGSESGWCFPTEGMVNFMESYLQLTGQAGGVQIPGHPRRALATGTSPKAAQIAHAVILETE